MESDELGEKEFLSTKQFLAGCSSQFRYDFAGDLRKGGRGVFHTMLDTMKNDSEWKEHFMRAPQGNAILYSRRMLQECKRRVLEKDKKPRDWDKT